jgi:hypothetical protein
MSQALIIGIGRDVVTLDDCLEKECKWYNTKTGLCVFESTPFVLVEILKVLKDISKVLSKKVSN